MNILFCTTSRVSEQKGGTERITARISQALRKKGHQCFLAYKAEIDDSLPMVKWDGEFNATTHSLESIIIDNHIEVIIIQKMTRDVKIFSSIREQHHLDLKIISVLHFNPGYELKDMSMSKALRILRNESKGLNNYVKNTVRVITYPFYRILYPLRDKNLYQIVYQYSDKVVLLSTAFIDEYADYCGLKDRNKFVVIPNALSYDEFFPVEKLCEKKKQALVVSRLVDPPKRVYLAIQAWAEIEKDPTLDGWTFKIVGSGPAENAYKALTNQLGLKRVEFCGRQEPRKYYEKSSIFLMTSSYEGWGLTLTEAQQFGCVPVAFDSYKSVRDIIIHGDNGCLVRNSDVVAFSNQVKQLIIKDDIRFEMAVKAINSSKRFCLDEIVNKWVFLFDSIV